MALFLSTDDVAKVWQMPQAIDAMRELCRTEARGETISAERIHMPLPNGFMRILPGALTDVGVFGFKEFRAGSSGTQYSVSLFDLETLDALAYVDAENITTMRTGALASVGLDVMAPEDAQTIGLIGSGKEAFAALQGMSLVRPSVKSGWVYSPTPERRELFAKRARTELGIALEVATTPEEAVGEADLVTSATNSRGAEVLRGEWVKNGVHVTSIGSTAPDQREIDAAMWDRMDHVAVDTMRLLHESGDAITAAELGVRLDSARVTDIASVVAEKRPGRNSSLESTMYKSVGSGLQDIAAAYRIYTDARNMGLGREAPALSSPPLPR
ncbi:ornithine cyclodeaminase family protein [Pseudonocardia sp. Cha107L01]|uniref:ornithine cyclodeaminase family protein n=1 Tax=Pseudonocardia sp. Cha107L01 TaxID=3457576 RepID=UPI00403E8FC7